MPTIKTCTSITMPNNQTLSIGDPFQDGTIARMNLNETSDFEMVDIYLEGHAADQQPLQTLTQKGYQTLQSYESQWCTNIFEPPIYIAVEYTTGKKYRCGFLWRKKYVYLSCVYFDAHYSLLKTVSAKYFIKK